MYGRCARPKVSLQTGIGPKWVNIQSATGLSVSQLEKEEDVGFAFACVNLRDEHMRPQPIIPRAEWDQIATECFSGCAVFSTKAIARAYGYKDPRSFDRAISKVQSSFHFIQNGPVRATTVTSAMAGIQNVREECDRRLQAGQAAGFLQRFITIP